MLVKLTPRTTKAANTAIVTAKYLIKDAIATCVSRVRLGLYVRATYEAIILPISCTIAKMIIEEIMFIGVNNVRIHKSNSEKLSNNVYLRAHEGLLSRHQKLWHLANLSCFSALAVNASCSPVNMLKFGVGVKVILTLHRCL